MIIRQLSDRVRLITQPAHAQLARRIMVHSASLRDRPRAESILLAIGEHDNGWQEEDAAPTLDLETGKVVDFVTAPLIVRHRVWPRAIGRLSDDPWAAALVAQHALTVYDRFRSDPAWSTFFADLAVLRDDMLTVSGGSREELAVDYPFVRLGDLISLTFCTGWTEPQQFAEWVVTGVGTAVTVDPNPFDAPISFEIPAVELRATAFKSTAELEKLFLATPQTMLSGEVVKTR